MLKAFQCLESGKSALKSLAETHGISTEGKYLHLGLHGNRKLALEQPKPVLVLGGLGGTRINDVLVPSILASDTCSLIIATHRDFLDTWPKVREHRESLGPFYETEWYGAEDKTDKPFNFLDPAIVLPPGPDRDQILSKITNIMIPRSRADSYFTDQARSTLNAFLQMLIAKIHDRKDSARWTDIPLHLLGKPASIFMMWVWWVQCQQKTIPQPSDEPIKEILLELIEEAQEWNYPQSAIREISSLMRKDDKDRAGILGTMQINLHLFEHPKIATGTSYSGFAMQDLRGRLTPQSVRSMGLPHYPRSKEDWDRVREIPEKQEWQPVSVFCDSSRYKTNILTRLFLELCADTLPDPGETLASGALVGPYPVYAVLPEFTATPRMSSLENPQDSKISYLLSTQDTEEITRVYQESGCETIQKNIPIQVLLSPQGYTSADPDQEKNKTHHRIAVANPRSQTLWVKTPSPA